MLDQLFVKHRSIGVVGNVGQGKTSLVLNELIELKKCYPNIPIYVLGTEPSIHQYLEQQKLFVLKSKEDVLDLKIRDAIIFVDEFADLFSVDTASRQLQKVKRFFNRIEHLNNYIIISSAQQGFWNKFVEGIIKTYIIKTIDYQALVNGTTLKRKIRGITENTSDYRLEIPINTYYIISDEEIVTKKTFKYNPLTDTKKLNKNLFQKK